MEDILDILDEVVKPEEKDRKSKKEVQLGKMGRIDYGYLKDLLKKEVLYVVKNVGKEDLVCDWDLSLMPEDLKPDFDKYLSDRYNVYQIKEANLDFRIVAVYREGRSINFLHQFMTERRIPNLEMVREGREVLLKSQFALPAGKMAIITEEQYKSLQRYEKRRTLSQEGVSDWSGVLVFKKITKPEQLEKIEYSFVTSQDIKNNNFEVEKHELVSERKPATMEYSDELDEF
jgi:hypothetical protein